MRTFWWAVTLGLLMLTPAAAEDLQSTSSVFLECDGYGVPSNSGDGMTKDAMRFGIFVPEGENGTTVESKVEVGGEGVAACDQALADPRLPPAFQLRRANLLIAKAVHHIAAGNASAALADLDLAAAAAPAPHDVFYDRSIGLDLDFVRAAALRQLNRNDEAKALAQRAWEARPYSLQNSASAFFASGSAGGLRSSAYGQAMARLNPRFLTVMLVEAAEAGDYTDVDKLSREIIPNSRFVDNDIAIKQEQARLYNWQERTTFAALRRGEYAVALAGQGRVEEAHAELATARTELASAMTEMPAPMNMFVAGDMRKAFADLAPKVKARSETILAETGTQVDRIAALPPGAFKPEAPKSLRLNEEMGELLHFLPSAEDGKLIPLYGKGDRELFTIGPNAAHYWQEDGTEWVSFSVYVTSEAVAEEMALLAAAQRALDLGHKGFVIVGRRDIRHGTLTYIQNMPGLPPTEARGELETQFAIDVVDPANLPEKYAGSAWRVIEAGPVVSALTPIYYRPILKSGRPKG